MKREKITLGWAGKSAPVPDVIFDDYVDPLSELVTPAPAVRGPVLPSIQPRTVLERHHDNVLSLLDRWADWMRTSEPLTEGVPRQCLGAPDARIHSFEDMEIEVNKRLVREVHTAVWELPVMQREAVMMHFGLNTRCVWRAQFDAIFDQAVHRLYEILKGRVAC
ncbi:hypothetical protein [Janthinobacterium sp. CG_23.4]|uniref:hypothetical protein n=1 Tax=Janthinobacterium sp. CG_23.4 TaxID=2760707 RepID=UPI002475BA09|nr:hypothetical protein [Janthinobacterium sp. CG_23.4]MDH6157417.1 hypothetical protein [Janthinobacterium sp. CG_23.4]